MLESVREAGALVCRRERHGVVVDERDCQSWSKDTASDVCVAAEANDWLFSASRTYSRYQRFHGVVQCVYSTSTPGMHLCVCDFVLY